MKTKKYGDSTRELQERELTVVQRSTNNGWMD